MQVVSYVLQGRLEEARQMLMKQATLHPASRNMYKLMDTLLSKMPFYNVRSFFNRLFCCVALGFGHNAKQLDLYFKSDLLRPNLYKPP